MILIKNMEFSIEETKQYYVTIVKEEMKVEIFNNLYESLKANQMLIYCNSYENIAELSEKLKRHDVNF